MDEPFANLGKDIETKREKLRKVARYAINRVAKLEINNSKIL